MKGIRRAGVLLIVLVVGMFLGHLSSSMLLLISAPLFLLWLLNWDEQKYQERQEQKNTMAYKRS